MTKKSKKDKKDKERVGARPKTFRKIFDFFDASITKVDCGAKCAPLNDGTPVCCDIENAVPIVQVAEWKVLKSRTKMWKRYKPVCAVTRKMCAEISDHNKAIECRGAKHCERDNRSLACRTFPFFPYITREGEILGLTHYWTHEGQCWVMNNMQMVEQDFIDQCLKAYKILFKDDDEEYEVFLEHSASMRRVFSRKDRPIPVITPEKEYLLVLPKGAGVEKVDAAKIQGIVPFGEDE